MYFYYIYKSKIGNIYIKTDENYVYNINFINLSSINQNIEYKKNIITEKVINQLEEYFNGKRKIFELPVKLIGSEFQKKVWKELEKIPYGQTKTYKDIAIKIGNPNASRAIGNANNKNPIAIVIPCHRVIGCNNKLIGYAGGIYKKIQLLELEKNNKKKE